MDNHALNAVVRQLRELITGRRIRGIDAFTFGVLLHLDSGPLCFSLRNDMPALFSLQQKVSSEGGYGSLVACLRSHLLEKTIAAVEKDRRDRRICFICQDSEEAPLHLWFEAIPRRVDLLVVSDSTVLCSARETAQIGKAYQPPTLDGGELDFYNSDPEDLLEMLSRAAAADKPRSALMDTVAGIDPALAEELLGAWAVGEDKARDILMTIRDGSFGLAVSGNEPPRLRPDIYEVVEDDSWRRFKDPMEAAGSWFRWNARYHALNRVRSSINAALKRRRKHVKSTLKRLKQEEKNLERDKHAGQLGDLILANVHAIKRGMDKVTLQNWYDDAGGEITIELDPQKDAAENAEQYYRKARKARRGSGHIQERRQEVQRQQQEAETIATKAEDIQEDLKALRALRNELLEKGWITRKKKKSKKQQQPPGRRFRSSDGLEIIVGRSSADNMRVTFEAGKDNDFWLHAAGVGGSHVIIKNQHKLDDPPPRSLAEAAALAAYYSKSRQGSNVQVHWTFRHQVRKMKGAGTGTVQLRSYRSIIVDPEIPSSVTHE